MSEYFTELPIEAIKFDQDNPRIKIALEKYGDKIDARRISFALSSATEGAQRVSSFDALSESIRANKGVSTPIIVVKRNGEYVCIDGNTRLAIYREFSEKGVAGDWSHIKSTILDNPDQLTIEKVRITNHLVGSRDWPAYEKARYLHHLRNEELLDFNELINLCGGNKKDIERQIQAFHDMNNFYRSMVDDASFRIDRFSGFVELQKPGVQDAIFDTGYELEDFGKWVRDGNIYRLEDVRRLPEVLRDESARKVFTEGGVNSLGEAIKEIDSRTWNIKNVTLENSTLHQLVKVLNIKIDNLPFEELLALQNKDHDSQYKIAAIEELTVNLDKLLTNVSE